MASESTPSDASPSDAKRKRLQQCFEHANRQMAHEKYDFDYVTDLFTQCVVGDPANCIYAQSLLANLKKKYNNNKRGSNLAFIKGAGPRAMVKKAMLQKDWDAVIRSGVEALKLNPWDSSTLLSMAAAAEEKGYQEVQMIYLKAALDGNPKAPEVLRACAQALAKRRQFDQAIVLWHRLEEVCPGDEEAARAIANLSVEKTIAKAGLDQKDPSRGRFAKEGQSQLQAATVEDSDIERLEKAIAKKPQELANYLELADLYIRDEQYAKAEETLAKAFEVSGGDVSVRERWEDAQLRCLRQQLSQAEKDAQKDEQSKARYKQLKKEFLRKELEVYRHRAERFPSNLGFKYDLGLRYQANAMYNEAIKEFQQAKNDSRRKGLCMLHLAQCFQQIHQPRLAMSSYQAAVEEIPDRDEENKKTALYQAGRLAMSLQQLDTAERYLNRLAEMDFGFKDVATLLEKIAKMREEGQNEESHDEKKE